MRLTRTTAGLAAAVALLSGPPATAATTSQPASEVLQFLDVSRPIEASDAGRRTASTVDVVFNDLLRHPSRLDAATRQVLGRFSHTCAVARSGEGQAPCRGTLVLRDGTIDVAGDFASASGMAVTGGSGRYEEVTGTAQLTPTQLVGTALLTVHLERPPS